MTNLEKACHNIKVAISWEWEYKKYRWRPRTRDVVLYYDTKSLKFKTKYANR